MEGTKDILQAAYKYGSNIKKFIYTSSLVAAVSLGSSSENRILTEDSWNSISNDPEEIGKS